MNWQAVDTIDRNQLRRELMQSANERGASQVVDTVLGMMEKKCLSDQEGSPVVSLEKQDWEECLDGLTRKNRKQLKSYNSRLRYRRILRRVSQELHKRGLSTDAPQLEVTPQHARESVVGISILGNRRLSDWTRLMDHVGAQLRGFGKDLIPPTLADQSECWLAILLASSGAASPFPIRRLGMLRWQDINIGSDFPIRWPRPGGRGYTWLWINPICRLVLHAMARNKQTINSGGYVFPMNQRHLARRINQFLRKECEEADIPVMTIEEFAQLAQFDLLRHLPNIYCSAIQGRIDFPPVPQDQVALVLAGMGEGVEPPPETTFIVNKPEPGGEGEDDLDHEEELREYDSVLKDLRPLLNAVWQENREADRETLSAWMKESGKDPCHTANNISKLASWQFSLIERRRIRLSSCRAYFTAVLRLIREVPSKELGEIREEDVGDALRDVPDWEGGGSRAASRKLSRAAWKSLHGFLEENGVDVQPMDWRRLRISMDRRPVRVIGHEEVRRLVRELQGTVLGAVVWLSFRTGLRVSEVCRLKIGDVDLTGYPCLAVEKSKRGVRRLVSQSHLGGPEREWLMKFIQKRNGKGNDPIFFGVDGESLDPKIVSRLVADAMRRIGIRKNGLEGQEVSFHDLRAAAADAFLGEEGDIRRPAIQLGHANVTTTEGYTRCLDLRAAQILRRRRDGYFNPEIHIPLSTLAVLLGVSDRRAVQRVREAEAALSERGELRELLKTPDRTPDGARPARPGKAAYFIQVADALWLLGRKAGL